MPWVGRDKFAELMLELGALKAELATYREVTNKYISWVEAQEDQLRFQIKEERQRAQYAIDELLKRHGAEPISPDAAERQQFTSAIDDLWAEDPVAVAKVKERIAAEGLGSVYADALEELNAE